MAYKKLFKDPRYRLDPEGFKPIPGHTMYGVSKDGIIIYFEGGEYPNKEVKRFIYRNQWYVSLYKKDEDGEIITGPFVYPVARLMMMTYCGTDGKNTWFADSNPMNLHIDNLYRTDLSRTLKDKYKTGAIKKPTGDRHWRTGTTHTKRTKRLMREAKKLYMDNNEITNE